MYEIEETIRYNNLTYYKGCKAKFKEDDLKYINQFVKKIEGEESNYNDNIVIENNKKETKRTTNKSTKK